MTLTTRQLAAARLLAMGRSVGEVARELGVTRQAIWKWRRRAEFVSEVLRVHERLIVGAVRRGGGMTGLGF